MVKGRIEVTVKFNELPQTRVLGDKAVFELDCDGRKVKAVALTEQFGQHKTPRTCS